MSRLTRDGTAEPVSRDQILRHARGQGNIHFPCSADHEQDWQPYPVDPYLYSAICDGHTYIHTTIPRKRHGYQSGTWSLVRERSEEHLQNPNDSIKTKQNKNKTKTTRRKEGKCKEADITINSWGAERRREPITKARLK